MIKIKFGESGLAHDVKVTDAQGGNLLDKLSEDGLGVFSISLSAYSGEGAILTFECYTKGLEVELPESLATIKVTDERDVPAK